MAKPNKVIITCAVTGAIHTPSMSKYLPLTPADIAQQAIDAAHAGAAILHLHARDPVDGRPSARLDVSPRLLDRETICTSQPASVAIRLESAT